MKNILLNLVVLLLCNTNIFAQTKSFTAVINDPDHYTNVRNSENGKVIDKLVEGQMFYVINVNVDPDWYQISYPDPKEQKKAFERFYNKVKEGYIHRSKVKFLDQLKNLSVKEIKNGYIFFDENFSLEVSTKDFDVKKHKITKNEYRYVAKIDDARPWGIDGNILPDMNELDKVIVTYNKVKIPFPKEAIKNMFQFTLNPKYIGVSKLDNHTYFFYSQNSDGAGSYESVWKIVDGKVVQQLISQF
ncbi:hypothetical protein [Soonwooa sp.]|uniref:hypothetical protein n=1 Tax=Soonwooa sp. TaxID=1938592 RepID=UPI002606B7F4|nr:hypothetical protein [Soonwooa sp.]